MPIKYEQAMEMAARKYSARMKCMDALFEREGGRCFYCDIPVRRLMLSTGPYPDDMATADHLILASEGGSTTPENTVLACLTCNNKRGNTPAWMFLAALTPA